MADREKFRQAKFAHPVRKVQVSAQLAGFFAEDGAEPEPSREWTVRGLTGGEVMMANDASSLHSSIDKAVQALDGNGLNVGELRELLGTARKKPKRVATLLEYMVAGCVAPTITLVDAVKIETFFPSDFFALASAINELNGEACDLVKPEAG